MNQRERQIGEEFHSVSVRLKDQNSAFQNRKPLTNSLWALGFWKVTTQGEGFSPQEGGFF